MALDLWLFPSPTRPTHIATTPIATTHIVLTTQMSSRCCNHHAWMFVQMFVLVSPATGDKMNPWGMFWRCYVHRVVSGFVLSLCSLSLSVWGSYVKKILKAILTDYTCISQYPQYILLVKKKLNKIGYQWEGVKMFSLTNKMVKKYINCLTFSKRKKSSSSRKHSLNERFTKLCLAGKRFSLSLSLREHARLCVTQASPAPVRCEWENGYSFK